MFVLKVSGIQKLLKKSYSLTTNLNISQPTKFVLPMGQGPLRKACTHLVNLGQSTV